MSGLIESRFNEWFLGVLICGYIMIDGMTMVLKIAKID